MTPTPQPPGVPAAALSETAVSETAVSETARVPDDASPAVWVNGTRQAAAGLHLSALDRGFTLADGAFETMRVYGGHAFRLDQHLARLARTLAALEIPAPPALRASVLAALAGTAGGDAAMRLTVSRGVGAAGVAPPAAPATTPTVIVVVNPPPRFPRSVYDVGLSAHVASGRRNEFAATAGHKTLAYTDAIVALLEARRAGADEALFLDTQGHCSEATASNLFARIGDTLVTPPPTCGVLPGITRAVVLERARSLGVAVAERVLELDELRAADEAFLTSSLRTLAPLVRVDAHPIGRGTPGALTLALLAAYDALVAQECRA
jgi:branched-chain amino acid aminotransferase